MKLPDLEITSFDPNSLVVKYTPDDSTPTFWENYSEHIQPILDSQTETTKKIAENYNKLKELYELKEIELKKAQEGEAEAKKYNKKMFRLAILSAILAGASLVATVIFGLLSL